MEGYLEKRKVHGLLPGWQRRFFRLDHFMLHYFADEKEASRVGTEPRGSIDLRLTKNVYDAASGLPARSARGRAPPRSPRASSKEAEERNVFVIEMREREYRLRASSEATKLHWLGVLRVFDGLSSFSNRPIPIAPVMQKAIETCIERVLAAGLERVGIFRVPAAQPSVRSQYQLLVTNQPLPADADIDCVAGCLKMLLRELPETLLTNRCFYDFVPEGDEDEEAVQAALDPERLHALVVSLPPTNIRILRGLFRLLSEVAAHCDVNQMDADNLATCLGPNLTPKERLEMADLRLTFRALVEHANIVFALSDAEERSSESRFRRESRGIFDGSVPRKARKLLGAASPPRSRSQSPSSSPRMQTPPMRPLQLAGLRIEVEEADADIVVCDHEEELAELALLRDEINNSQAVVVEQQRDVSNLQSELVRAQDALKRNEQELSEARAYQLTLQSDLDASHAAVERLRDELLNKRAEGKKEEEEVESEADLRSRLQRTETELLELRDMQAAGGCESVEPDVLFRHASVYLVASEDALVAEQARLADAFGNAFAAGNDLVTVTQTLRLKRPKWVRDEDAATCHGCETSFTLFVRRHHCRLCGHVLCHTCSSVRVSHMGLGLQNARVCDPCAKQIAAVSAAPKKAKKKKRSRAKNRSRARRKSLVSDRAVMMQLCGQHRVHPTFGPDESKAEFIIACAWLRDWLDHAHKGATRPGSIQNRPLLNAQGKLRDMLERDKDWRTLPAPVWKALVRMYGGGPAIPWTEEAAK